MKTWFFIALVTFFLSGCSNNIKEPPLNLRIGAEPSAKSRNELGIEHYKAGRYFDALLHFNQANYADPTSGEIHFNLGLAYLQEGKKKKAAKNFRMAQKLAKENPKILESVVIKELLKEN